MVHLIDVADSQDLWRTYQSVRAELREYSKGLVKKKEIIVINKIDLVEKDVWRGALDEFKSKRKKVVAISASKGEGVDNLKEELEGQL